MQCRFLLNVIVTQCLTFIQLFASKNETLLIWWNTFSLGLAPLVIGLFFFSSVQLFFIGVIGEYLGAVWTQVRNRPLVIEEERINF